MNWNAKLLLQSQLSENELHFMYCLPCHSLHYDDRLLGHTCNWFTSFSCGFWSRPIFNRRSPNGSSTKSLCSNFWNCSIAKILAKETFSKRRCIEYTENSWVFELTSVNRSTIFFTRYKGDLFWRKSILQRILRCRWRERRGFFFESAVRKYELIWQSVTLYTNFINYILCILFSKHCLVWSECSCSFLHTVTPRYNGSKSNGNLLLTDMKHWSLQVLF